MFGIGWTEMLVIGVVALIVIGPKDLPVVMARVGKVVGQIRRMGMEFQREINKTTGLDEIRNLRSSITEPLRKTTEEIRREFNAMTPTGVKPSGIIKPADPKAESVVNEIRAAAGIVPPATVAEPAVVAPPMVANKAPRRAPAKAKAVPDSAVAASDLGPVAEPVKAARVAKKVAVVTAETPAVLAPTAKPPAKAAAKKASAASAKPAVPRKAPAKKPAADAGEA